MTRLEALQWLAAAPGKNKIKSLAGLSTYFFITPSGQMVDDCRAEYCMGFEDGYEKYEEPNPVMSDEAWTLHMGKKWELEIGYCKDFQSRIREIVKEELAKK